MKKYFKFKKIGTGLIAFSLLFTVNSVSATTRDEIIAQIAILQAQLTALQNAQNTVFTQNLTLGSTGNEVVALQTMLVSKGYLVMPAGVSYGYFGGLTQAALAKWQLANDVSPAAGYWGPISRSKYASLITAPVGAIAGSNISDSLSKRGGGSFSGASSQSQSSTDNLSTQSTSKSSGSSERIDEEYSPSGESNNSSNSGISTPTPSNESDLEWGAFVGYSASDLSSFEQLVGKPVDMRAVFVNWNDPFPSSFASNLKSSGKKLVIFWEQYNVSLDTILSGQTDSYIRQFASAAKSYGGEVILAPLHEMNGNWDPWGGTVGTNTPEKVVATWKHIYDIFGSISNVKFAWAINNISVPNTAANAIAKYYPGEGYVDYVAVDGFNFGNPWQSFDQIFKSTLNEVSQYGKPIYILSTASSQGSQKASWILDFGAKVETYPLLKGWIWFNENKEKDWRVNSDSNSIEAFKSILP